MPNPTASAQTVRTAFDIAKWDSGTVPIDLVTSTNIQLGLGCDLLWQMIFSTGTLADGTIEAFTNIASVVIALQDASTHTTTYWSQTVLNASIIAPGAGSPALTAANWTNGTQQQISLAIPHSVWNTLSMTGQTTFCVCIFGVTTDATPKTVPYAFFLVTIFNTGMPVSTPLASPSVLGYQSYLCSDGLYRRLTILPNGSIQVINPSGSSSP